MGRDQDDHDGRLVWPEIEKAIRLDEIIISTGGSVPVSFGVEISITRVGCSCRGNFRIQIIR
jgi:hypothetical protein